MTDDEILDTILRHEAGYVNHPADTGGCTNFGITIGTLRDWRGVPVTCEDVKQLTEAEARQIYRVRYLSPFVDVTPEVKAQVVDIAVNSGVKKARELLRMAEAHRGNLGFWLVIERLRFYARIVRGNPSQSAFMLGWVNRAVSFLEEPVTRREPLSSFNDTGSEIPGGGAAG